MDFSLMSDNEIMAELADRLDLTRRNKTITDEQLIVDGGSNHNTLNRFRSHQGGISLVNFIRLLRGVGALDQLEQLLKVDAGYSPAADVAGKQQKEPPKRIRKKRGAKATVKWGDER